MQPSVSCDFRAQLYFRYMQGSFNPQAHPLALTVIEMETATFRITFKITA